jgi:hypothetical protein
MEMVELEPDTLIEMVYVLLSLFSMRTLPIVEVGLLKRPVERVECKRQRHAVWTDLPTSAEAVASVSTLVRREVRKGSEHTFQPL